MLSDYYQDYKMEQDSILIEIDSQSTNLIRSECTERVRA